MGSFVVYDPNASQFFLTIFGSGCHKVCTCPLNGTSSHHQISIFEAFSLYEATKLKEVSCTSTVYINTNPDRKQNFKKVTQATETSFRVEGESGHYELLSNIASRHNMRRNAQGNGYKLKLKSPKKYLR